MIKLYDNGVYLMDGTEIVEDTGSVSVPVSKDEAAQNTMAYGILKEHNTSSNSLIFECPTSKSRFCSATFSVASKSGESCARIFFANFAVNITQTATQFIPMRIYSRISGEGK